MALQSGIQTFGKKYGLGEKRTYRLQICIEEWIYDLLANCFPTGSQVNAELSVFHDEIDNITRVTLSCGGVPYNPFIQPKD